MKRLHEDGYKEGYVKIHGINDKQNIIVSENPFKREKCDVSLSERIKSKVLNSFLHKNSDEKHLETVAETNARKDIFEAVENKNLSRIKELVEKYHLNVNLKDDYGFSLLHHAVSSGQEEIVDFLIEAGADVNIVNNKVSSLTPLYYAVSRKNFEITSKLVEAGANIHALTSEGNTILHEAAYAGNVKAVQLILENPEGKNLINFKNDLSWTALDNAIETFNNEIIKILLDHKANIEKSLLHAVYIHASYIGNVEACEILIDAGAPINVVDEFGSSLHPAYLGIANDCSNDYSTIILLESKLDNEVKDNAGNLPKDLLGESY